MAETAMRRGSFPRPSAENAYRAFIALHAAEPVSRPWEVLPRHASRREIPRAPTSD